MKLSTLSIALVLGVAVSVAFAIPVSKGKCDPEKCKLPGCRCWNDPHTPGDIKIYNIPQMILLTFDFAFNNHTVVEYMKLFESLTNPNGCKAKGTFFVQSLNSEVDTIKRLYKDNHELAINSADGIIPTNRNAWKKSIKAVEDFLKESGVPMKEVKGLLSPNFFNGGNSEYEVMRDFDLSYEASCVNVEHSAPKNLLWPYTLDNVEDTPKCSIGHTVNKTFPGLWSFPGTVLDYKGLQCPVPSGCLPSINMTDDVFRLFYDAFDDHYYNGREPFVVNIDPQWVTEEYRVTGTKEFLELVAAYPDTWILTMSQALKWVKDPLAMPMGTMYDPWGCSGEE